MAESQRKPPPPDQTVHHESARGKRRGKGRADMSGNMTPMIDVTFLLLIFFVVATNFAKQEGTLASKLPDLSPAGNPPQIPPLELVVSEPSEGVVEVRMNNTPVRISELYNELERIKGSYPTGETTVVLKPNRDVGWEHVLATYNATLRAGYRKINWSGE